MTAAALIAVWTVWAAVILLVLALCRAAAYGEQALVSCEGPDGRRSIPD